MVLVVLCTAAAFLIYVTLVTEVGPGRAAVITYVAPVLAVGLGVAVLGEHPGAGSIAGLLLILAGSWLSTDGRLPPGLTRLLARASRRPASEPRRPSASRRPRRCAGERQRPRRPSGISPAGLAGTARSAQFSTVTSVPIGV